MKSRKQKLADFVVYGVTDIKTYDLGILHKIESALKGGVDIIQLRSKSLSDLDLYNLGMKIRKIATEQDKLFFVNDRVDLAIALKADGVHIGQDDLPVKVVRQMAQDLGEDFLIGKSTHSLVQAQETLLEDVDYIGVGPIFKTPTKEHYNPVGLDLLKSVKEIANKPFVAIGGIDLNNVEEVFNHGGKRVAVVRALFDQTDVFNAAQAIRTKLRGGNN